MARLYDLSEAGVVEDPLDITAETCAPDFAVEETRHECMLTKDLAKAQKPNIDTVQGRMNMW